MPKDFRTKYIYKELIIPKYTEEIKRYQEFQYCQCGENQWSQYSLLLISSQGSTYSSSLFVIY